MLPCFSINGQQKSKESKCTQFDCSLSGSFCFSISVILGLGPSTESRVSNLHFTLAQIAKYYDTSPKLIILGSCFRWTVGFWLGQAQVQYLSRHGIPLPFWRGHVGFGYSHWGNGRLNCFMFIIYLLTSKHTSDKETSGTDFRKRHKLHEKNTRYPPFPLSEKLFPLSLLLWAIPLYVTVLNTQKNFNFHAELNPWFSFHVTAAEDKSDIQQKIVKLK